MFREFFSSGFLSQRAFAWFGLAVFVLHSFFKAYIKAALNGWYGRFYDTMQEQVSTVSTVSVSNEIGSGFNSGNMTDLQREHLNSKRNEIYELLLEFFWLVLPTLAVHPVAKYISNVWQFSWRISLVNSYLAHTDVSKPLVPNAAQRIHEDTARFESGIRMAGSVVLDSFLTLFVFIPILVEAGKRARPEWVPDWIGDAWLTAIAIQASLYGITISAFVGRKLVDLEIKNQDAEANLRTKLVLLETHPTSFMEDLASEAFTPSISTLPPPPPPPPPPDPETLILQATISDDDRHHHRHDNHRHHHHHHNRHHNRPEASRLDSDLSLNLNPLQAFVKTLRVLWENYRALFREFFKFNLWISLFDQALILLPYFLVAPLLFAEDPNRRITLGTLTRLVGAFDKVFSSLSVVSDSWTSINDFRSVVRRLSYFESQTYTNRSFDTKRVYSQIQTEVSTRTRIATDNNHNHDNHDNHDNNTVEVELQTGLRR